MQLVLIAEMLIYIAQKGAKLLGNVKRKEISTLYQYMAQCCSWRVQIVKERSNSI